MPMIKTHANQARVLKIECSHGGTSGSGSPPKYLVVQDARAILRWLALPPTCMAVATLYFQQVRSVKASVGQEEWTNSRHKAPSARTTKGIYRDQPYARY
ncbi:KH domain-containing, RNA-binding, signal transduction-associated protein 3 [Chelonia mydas]|uniref:KH domain-containing, RNA-binding, signal transduction-associated protein 3 n=1 Tax=Chelonia mydas TaxID=8469 RepID=M7B6W5_CHEMY|nr:KH domain-containing, RNA-binding, signal transduction-associated protein 3 [Chelonia mydas]